MASTFRIYMEGLQQLTKALELTSKHLDDAIRKAMIGEAGTVLVNEMKSRVPRGPGRLPHAADSIKIEPIHGAVLIGYRGPRSGGAVRNGRLQKGVWLESGTKPHIIRAKRSKVLFIFGKNVSEVHHPGSRPQRIARKSMKAAKWDLEDAIVDELNHMAEQSGWTGGYVGL